MASGTRQSSVRTSFAGSPRATRHAFTPATRSGEQRNSSVFLRTVPTGTWLSRLSDHLGINFSDAHNDIAPRRPVDKFVVGIDYGTTFTSVSYYVAEKAGEEHLARASDIKTVKDWPDAPYEGDEQVPTETWYPPVPLQREPLNENEQYDAPRSNLSSTQILEEEYGDEDDEQDQGPDERSPTLAAADEVETESWSFDEPQSTEFFWGYTVASKRYQENLTRDPKLLVQRPKLMMLGTAYTEGDRRDLRRKINHLVHRGIIRKYGRRSEPDVRDIRDVIMDFLIKVFEHTKRYLTREEGYTRGCRVEFVVTVPTIWSQEASRILQFCVEAAIQVTEFGELKNGSVDNLFLIPEPEGGLTWLLQITRAMVGGETVINLDAGGGTVDCVTYEITSDYPLRLGREIVAPGGDNCGSSYLNENFEAHLKERLKDETNLLKNGRTLPLIVSSLSALDFEKGKKTIDIYKRPTRNYVIWDLRSDKSRGLVGPSAKRFGDNKVFLNGDDFSKIFMPILHRVWAVLRDQLDASFEKRKIVKNVFLLGGFAGSTSLVTMLREVLKEYSKGLGLPYQIRLVEDTKKSNAAVSSGAVLRALNKENGPRRFAQSSYGFLRREPYQPLICKAHSRTTPKRDPIDGELYVDVINYFMRKGSLINPVHEFLPIRAIHTFEVDKHGPKLEMKCEELLWVSDTATESHYTLTNHKNKDAQLAGSIVTNVSILRNENHINITNPESDGVGDDNGVVRKPHYRVEYDLVVIVEGRNLRYEARWPPMDHHDEIRKRKRAGKSSFVVLETAQVSIASAFQPGTG